jgi:hypothetical protein
MLLIRTLLDERSIIDLEADVRDKIGITSQVIQWGA